MKRRNHFLLLICACAFIGAEQLIMGALKGNKIRKEAAPTRRPTLNERLTALEARVAALEGEKTRQTDTTELIETTTPAASELSPADGIDTTTAEAPITEEIVASEVETSTPIIPLEDLASNLGVTLQAPVQSEESLILNKILAEQQQ